MKFSLLRSIRRFVTTLLGTLAVIAVTILFAFLALRIAIHGREVPVPNLAGLSDADAANAAKDLGLNLSVENRFYSPSVPQNHVLSQAPAAGSRVRRGWQVRITESLGPQSVSVPDVTGQTERPASVILRRLQLDLGSVAHLPAPSPAGIVLAQSPPANSKGLNGPRVALLVSDDETEADTPAYVMPSLVGMTLGAASLKLAGGGLHIASAQSPEQPDPVQAAGQFPDAATSLPVPVATGTATIISQSPPAGHRVTRSDTIRVTLSH
jgi:beta-lactam-binding protein with PASTA domain